jgi:hypothetical protein
VSELSMGWHAPCEMPRTLQFQCLIHWDYGVFHLVQNLCNHPLQHFNICNLFKQTERAAENITLQLNAEKQTYWNTLQSVHTVQTEENQMLRKRAYYLCYPTLTNSPICSSESRFE